MKVIEARFGTFEKDGVRYRIRPEDGDALSPREWAEQNGYTRVDKTAVMLDRAKVRKKQEIAAARYVAEFGGFDDSSSGLFVRTDERTRSLLTAAKVRAQSDSDYVVEHWKTESGVFITLDAPTIIALESAVHDFIEAQFAREAQLTATVDAATTVEELGAIHWGE